MRSRTPGAAAVLIDELYAGHFQGTPNRQVVSCRHGRLAVKQLGAANEAVVEIVKPAANQDQSRVAVARPVNIELDDRLRAKGELNEALVSYRRALTICNARIAENGTNARAHQDFDFAVNKIGCLTFEFLLVRNVARALQAIEEAMSYRPDWVWLHKIHAHALMLGGRITYARNVHRENCGRTLEHGEAWGDSIRPDFTALRAAGFKLPIMDDFEWQFASKQ